MADRGATSASLTLTTSSGVCSKESSDYGKESRRFHPIVEMGLSYHRRELWQAMDWGAFESALLLFPQLRDVQITFRPEDLDAVVDAKIWTKMNVLCKTERPSLSV